MGGLAVIQQKIERIRDLLVGGLMIMERARTTDDPVTEGKI